MLSIPHRGRGTARLAVSVAAIAVVLHGIDPAALGRLLSTAAPRLLIPAIALGALAQASAFPQWAVLIGERSSLGWRPLASVFLRATFIGQALPTGVGGDAVRTVEVGRTLGYGTALGSVIASHLMGLLAMGCWAVAGSVFVSGLPAGMSRVLAAAFLLAVTVLALGALNGDRVLHRVRGGRRVTRMLVEVGQSLASYRSRRRLLASAFAVCIVGWALSLVSMVLFASSVGAHPGWQVFALAVPVSLAATLLPVTINGFGVREGIFVGILAHTGVGTVAATAIAVFADLQILPVALLGAALCLGRLRPRRRAIAVTRLSQLSPQRDHC